MSGESCVSRNAVLEQRCCLERQTSGFMRPRDQFLHNTESNVAGIFYAGAVTAPKSVGESLNEGTAAARGVIEYLAAKECTDNSTIDE